MEWLLILILNATGYNFTFWAAVSLLRWLSENANRFLNRVTDRLFGTETAATPSPASNAIAPHEVAVMIAAHNEEITLPSTLAALKRMVAPEQIYVGSDASTDSTVKIAREAGVNVLDLTPNRGKAKIMVALLETHKLTERYKAILLLDADILVNEYFLYYALPFFNDSHIAAVAGHSISRWHSHWRPRWSLFFTAYRIRLWRLLQYGVRYGQTWRFMNMTTIAPGGASLYRADVLAQLKIDVPGLIIEDFNMTFEVHHKNLGKIAFDPRAYVVCQEPYTLRDYVNQINRWHLGWWQTVIRHGIWPSLFWLATSLYQLELMIYSFLVLSVPLLLAFYAFNGFEPLTVNLLDIGNLSVRRASLTFAEFFFSVFAVDYLITNLVALIEKKPVLSLYGIGFFFIRMIDVVSLLWTLPVALFMQSEGRWISPARKAVTLPEHPTPPDPHLPSATTPPG